MNEDDALAIGREQGLHQIYNGSTDPTGAAFGGGKHDHLWLALSDRIGDWRGVDALHIGRFIVCMQCTVWMDMHTVSLRQGCHFSACRTGTEHGTILTENKGQSTAALG
jgi:hypothetical protein